MGGNLHKVTKNISSSIKEHFKDRHKPYPFFELINYFQLLYSLTQQGR